VNTELIDRLSSLRVEVDTETAERHVAAISAALTEPPTRVSVGRRFRLRLAPVLAGLALMVAPATGVAVAAESSVPGDVLYPVKQVTEQVRSWFDPGVAADHRLDELETVIDRGAGPDEVAERLANATDAVIDFGAGDDRSAGFDQRLDAARDRIRTSDPATTRQSGSPADGPADPGREGAGHDDGRDGRDSDPNQEQQREPGESDTGSDVDPVRTRGDDDRGTGATTTTSTTSVPPRGDDRPADSGGGGGAGGGSGGGAADRPPRSRGDA
jgi:hypothetical protein